eukprot:460128-Pyramimonas_sp.AAC.1
MYHHARAQRRWSAAEKLYGLQVRFYGRLIVIRTSDDYSFCARHPIQQICRPFPIIPQLIVAIPHRRYPHLGRVLRPVFPCKASLNVRPSTLTQAADEIVLIKGFPLMPTRKQEIYACHESELGQYTTLPQEVVRTCSAQPATHLFASSQGSSVQF